MRWVWRIIRYALVLAVLAVAVLAGTYYAGIRLPIYSDVVAVAFQNWNKTGQVEAEADYDASLVRDDGRIHFTVDLQVPETTRRLRAFFDGGRSKLVECRGQAVYLHGMPDAQMQVDGNVIGLTGTVEIELDGFVDFREGKGMAASVLLGHTPTTVWAQMQSLVIEDLPDPLVEPLIRDLAFQEYTREEILAMAANGLSPELAELLARYRDPLDLQFENIAPGQDGHTLTLAATFSIDEGTAFDMIGERIADAGAEVETAFAALAGVGRAEAQIRLPGGIGDALEEMGGSDVRDAIEGALEGQDVQDALGKLSGLADCQTAF